MPIPQDDAPGPLRIPIPKEPIPGALIIRQRRGGNPVPPGRDVGQLPLQGPETGDPQSEFPTWQDRRPRGVLDTKDEISR